MKTMSGTTLILALLCLGIVGHAQTCLDLSSVCNMGFRDDYANDGRGGWSDDGGNDYRHIPLGNQTFCGIPFKVIDPTANKGKSCVVLYGQPRTNYPQRVTVPVNRKAAALAFLHTLTWNDKHMPVAVYIVHYADGSKTEIPIRVGKEILGFWGNDETDDVKLAHQAPNLMYGRVSIYAWTWTNPKPSVTIKTLELVSTGSKGCPVIVAATALDAVQKPTSSWLAHLEERDQSIKTGWTWIEGEDYKNTNNKSTNNLVWPDPAFSGGKLHTMNGPSTRPLLPSDPLHKIYDEGIINEYDFEVEGPGEYALWVRTGPAMIWSPMRWQVDGGAWGDIHPKHNAYYDLWEAGTWAHLGWVKLGQVTLAGGRHTLTLHTPNPNLALDKISAGMDELGAMSTDRKGAKKEKKGKNKGKKGKSDGPKRMRFGFWLDCVLISRIDYTPCMHLKPGMEFQNPRWFSNFNLLYTNLSREPLKPLGQNESFDLDGLWAMARDQDPYPYPFPNPDSSTGCDEEKLFGPETRFTPPEQLKWMAKPVPPDEPRMEEKLLHKRWYRKRVGFMPEFRGKRFTLNVSEANYASSVFVNGRFCGAHRGGYVPFQIDITDALKPGELNDIMICVKCLGYYRTTYNPARPLTKDFNHRAYLAPGNTGWHKKNLHGLNGSVWIETHGPVYGRHVFVQSRYAEKKLISSVELVNPGTTSFQGKLTFKVKDPDSGDVVRTFDAMDVEIPADGWKEYSATGSAAGLEPWWPCPEKANGKAKLYLIQACLSDANGNLLDTCEDRFGFREVTIDKHFFRINGVRYNFRSVLSGSKRGKTLDSAFAPMREYNINVLRIPHGSYNGLFKKNSQKTTLDYLDEHGIPNRYCSQLNGMFIDIAIDDPRFWEITTDYYKKFIKAFRNHPSIMVWTAGNEVDLISNMAGQEKRKLDLWAMMKEAHAIDPTRGVMEDGAGDLLGNCEICNWHYPEVGPIADPNDKSIFGKARDLAFYPDNAYTLQRLSHRNAVHRPWDRKRPLWVGETMFLAGKVSRWCWVLGDRACHGRLDANHGSAEFLCQLGRGYRWVEAAGFNLFTHHSRIPGRKIKNTLAPTAVFAREYNTTFYPETTAPRTLKIFNDTLDPAPIGFRWSLNFDGKEVCGASSTHTIEPGFNKDLAIELKLPSATRRLDGDMTFVLTRNGKEVFREATPVSVLPDQAAVDPGRRSVMLYDPKNNIGAQVRKLIENVKTINALASVGNAPDVLIIGPYALPEGGGPDFKKLEKFALAGGRILVLEQEKPILSKALPAPCSSSLQEGAYAFPRGNHPVCVGMRKRDLACWANGHTVFKGSYHRTGTWGVIVDASAQENLTMAPMIESPWGKGHYILNQLLIGSKLGKEPVADKLLINSVRYLLDKQPATGRLAILEPNDIAVDLKLKASKIPFKTVQPSSSMDLTVLYSDADVILIQGNRRFLGMLLETRNDLRDFTNHGGWIYLMALDQYGTKELSKLIGEPLIWRPVDMERLVVINRDDPLMRGIGSADLHWYQRLTKEEYTECKWMHGDYPIEPNVFTGALIYDNICALAHNSGVANGMLSSDFWPYIYYGGEQCKLNWRQPIVINKVTVREDRHYKRMQEITLTLDQDPSTAQKVNVPDEPEVLEFSFPPRKTTQLTLEATKYIDLRGHGPFNWEEVEIIRPLSDSFKRKVIPLSRPAGLVKFPMGNGGILLNNLAVREPLGQRAFIQFLYNMGITRPAVSVEGKAKSSDGPDIMDMMTDEGDDDDLMDLGF